MMRPIERDDLPLERAFRWEKETPDKVYLTQPLGGGKVRDYTWRQTLDEARRMAAYLKSLGFEPGSRIAILSKNCASFILSDLAIWMAGHVSVALYPTLDAKMARYILEHSDSKLLFVGKLDTWEAVRPGVPEGLPCVRYALAPPVDCPSWEDIIARTAPLEGHVTRAPDDLALLLYTSGSTGRPKGVGQTFRAIASMARGAREVFPLQGDDRVLSYLPLAHAYERAAIEALSLYVNLHVYFAESLDTFLDDLKRARPTLFQSVPRLWLKFQLGVFQKLSPGRLATLLKIPIVSRIVRRKILAELGLDSTRIAISASAPIPPDVIQWYRDLGLELLEGYAMTENFSYSHFSVPGKARVGYVGVALPGVEVRLSAEGEVLVKSPASMHGYFKEPELTAESFTEDGFFKTGDRGEIDEQGRLRITGRVKELFKTSRGKYVAPAPIENLLNADNCIEQSCVTGAGQAQPFALVMLAEELRGKVASPAVRAEVNEALARLLDAVNAQLPSHEQLEFLAVVKEPWLIENGLLTPTMKIRRSELEERYAPLVEGWYAAKRPVVWED